MIPGITEIGFPEYATLHQATVSFEEMGERTISTQVRIDGGVVPDFSGWELEFRGERFVLPTLKPQASKDNSTKNALVDLVFTSSPIHELKRFFFAEMAQVDNGTLQGVNIVGKYIASLRLNLVDFVAAFNKVLAYYFPDGRFVMDLNQSYVGEKDVKDFPIDYMYIWDVLLKINEVYGVTWRMVTNQQGVTVIRVGYDMGSIPSTDHVFQYGFDGGLLRFERHVEDTDVYNVLLGRGGDKNIPYRYFKYADKFNPVWTADPDAISELETVYFDRLLDSNFRNYVQGWKTNSRRILKEGESVEPYDAARGYTDWAYAKGHDDEKFDPVEYVKDDDSIALYGIRQGKLDDNDEIFPTIQGVDFPDDDPDIGRVDETVDVHVTAEDSEEAEYDIVTQIDDVTAYVRSDESETATTVRSGYVVTVPEGRVGRIEYSWYSLGAGTIVTGTGNSMVHVESVLRPHGMTGIPAGTYRIVVQMTIVEVPTPADRGIRGRFGISNIRLHCTPAEDVSYRQLFTIWAKNIWQTTQEDGETDLDYAHRVWDPILGNKIGESAAVCFSDGFMSTSEDYEFLIRKLPEVDRTKVRNGVRSEWKITLLRSDAEYEATGLYTPNTTTGGVPVAGDHFFFTGIDLPSLYVKWAEKRLTESKQDCLNTKAWTNPTWVVSLDKIKANEQGYAGVLSEKLDAGILVTITDPRFTRGADGEQQQLTLGVRSVSFTWNEPSGDSPYIVPDIDVVLSDKIEHVESYNDVQNEITFISRNYVTNTEAKKIAKSARVVTPGIGIDDNICYLGDVIGTVEE